MEPEEEKARLTVMLSALFGGGGSCCSSPGGLCVLQCVLRAESSPGSRLWAMGWMGRRALEGGGRGGWGAGQACLATGL